MKGLISYRTERSEVYRNRVKRGYIAFAQRIYRLTEKRGHFGPTDLFSLSACYKSWAQPILRSSRQMRYSHLLFCYYSPTISPIHGAVVIDCPLSALWLECRWLPSPWQILFRWVCAFCQTLNSAGFCSYCP